MKLDDAADATWLCNRCLSSLKSKKIPGTALDNNMQVSDVLKELRGLNSLEERLNILCYPFHEASSATMWTSEGYKGPSHQLSHSHEKHSRRTAPSS